MFVPSKETFKATDLNKHITLKDILQFESVLSFFVCK